LICSPNHVITFVRPKQTHAPNLATFKVPLQFNKLDLRDYLFHAYKVKVTAVRSFISQQAPARKGNMRGRWYRPQPQKTMIAELERPFVWPEPPAEHEREDFDYDMWKDFNDSQEVSTKMHQQRQEGRIPSRAAQPKSEDVVEMGALAKQLRSGQMKWTNNSNLDEIWNGHIGKEVSRKGVKSKSVARADEKFDDSVIFEEDEDAPKKP
jgi:large subunit ribosomal protein L23